MDSSVIFLDSDTDADHLTPTNVAAAPPPPSQPPPTRNVADAWSDSDSDDSFDYSKIQSESYNYLNDDDNDTGRNNTSIAIQFAESDEQFHNFEPPAETFDSPESDDEVENDNDDVDDDESTEEDVPAPIQLPAPIKIEKRTVKMEAIESPSGAAAAAATNNGDYGEEQSFSSQELIESIRSDHNYSNQPIEECAPPPPPSSTPPPPTTSPPAVVVVAAADFPLSDLLRAVDAKIQQQQNDHDQELGTQLKLLSLITTLLTSDKEQPPTEQILGNIEAETKCLKTKFGCATAAALTPDQPTIERAKELVDVANQTDDVEQTAVQLPPPPPPPTDTVILNNVDLFSEGHSEPIEHENCSELLSADEPPAVDSNPLLTKCMQQFTAFAQSISNVHFASGLDRHPYNDFIVTAETKFKELTKEFKLVTGLAAVKPQRTPEEKAAAAMKLNEKSKERWLAHSSSSSSDENTNNERLRPEDDDDDIGVPMTRKRKRRRIRSTESSTSIRSLEEPPLLEQPAVVVAEHEDPRSTSETDCLEKLIYESDTDNDVDEVAAAVNKEPSIGSELEKYILPATESESDMDQLFVRQIDASDAMTVLPAADSQEIEVCNELLMDASQTVAATAPDSNETSMRLDRTNSIDYDVAAHLSDDDFHGFDQHIHAETDDEPAADVPTPSAAMVKSEPNLSLDDVGIATAANTTMDNDHNDDDDDDIEPPTELAAELMMDQTDENNEEAAAAVIDVAEDNEMIAPTTSTDEIAAEQLPLEPAQSQADGCGGADDEPSLFNETSANNAIDECASLPTEILQSVPAETAAIIKEEEITIEESTDIVAAAANGAELTEMFTEEEHEEETVTENGIIANDDGDVEGVEAEHEEEHEEEPSDEPLVDDAKVGEEKDGNENEVSTNIDGDKNDDGDNDDDDEDGDSIDADDRDIDRLVDFSSLNAKKKPSDVYYEYPTKNKAPIRPPKKEAKLTEMMTIENAIGNDTIDSNSEVRFS